MIQITWLGHGTVKLELEDGETILLDAWTAGNPAYPKDHKFTRIDTLLLTHGHYDHIDDAIPLALQFKPKIVCIYELARWLAGKGITNVREMNKGGSQQAGSLRVTMTHAVHSCGILDAGKIIYGGEAAGYVLHLPDKRTIYFSGDTNVFSDMQLIRELYCPELAFLPIGNLYTMGPKEAAKACDLLSPRQVIPMHFGTFPALCGRPSRLRDYLGPDSKVEVLDIEPGKPLRW